MNWSHNSIGNYLFQLIMFHSFNTTSRSGKNSQQELSTFVMIITTLEWLCITENITQTSQIISVLTVCLTICSGTDQRKHQSSSLLAFVRRTTCDGWLPPYKGAVTQKTYAFDHVFELTDTLVSISMWLIFKLTPYGHSCQLNCRFVLYSSNKKTQISDFYS